ncbi:hypothetical protein BDD12DRAFT_896684 [Trichophaea hybrida]|nr:hypothetical protein BDD12DRAFT_896684 [Trichophaea hybrida]
MVYRRSADPSKSLFVRTQRISGESDDECTFMYPGLDYSINGLTATVNNNEVDTKPAKYTFIQRVSRELKQQGVYPTGGRPNARRGDPDTLFPEPDEHGYLPGVWDPTEWLKSLKPPINWTSLLKFRSRTPPEEEESERRRTLDLRFDDSAIATSGMELQKNFSKVFLMKPLLKALMKPAKSLMLL